MCEPCLFCKIAHKQIPSKIVYEDDHVVAFEDITPKAPVHILIIPKKHIVSLAEIQTEDRNMLGHLLGITAELAKKKGLTDFRTVMNAGREAGQTVFHLHLHLLGGRAFTWPPG